MVVSQATPFNLGNRRVWLARLGVGGAACMDSVLCTLTGNAYSLLSTCFPRAKMCSVQEAGETQLPRKKSQ